MDLMTTFEFESLVELAFLVKSWIVVPFGMFVTLTGLETGLVLVKADGVVVMVGVVDFSDVGRQRPEGRHGLVVVFSGLTSPLEPVVV